MTWLEFFSSIISSLAWPAVFLVGLLVLREPLLKALPRLRKVKFKQIEAEFSSGLEKTKQDVKAVGLEHVEDAEIVEDLHDRLEQISAISPNAAILAAFQKVEQSAKALIKIKGSDPNDKIGSPYKLIVASPDRLIERNLEETNSLSKEEMSIYKDLRLLRNNAAHPSFAASKKQADEYIELVALLVSRIDKIITQSPKG